MLIWNSFDARIFCGDVFACVSKQHDELLSWDNKVHLHKESDRGGMPWIPLLKSVQKSSVLSNMNNNNNKKKYYHRHQTSSPRLSSSPVVSMALANRDLSKAFSSSSSFILASSFFWVPLIANRHALSTKTRIDCQENNSERGHLQRQEMASQRTSQNGYTHTHTHTRRLVNRQRPLTDCFTFGRQTKSSVSRG